MSDSEGVELGVSVSRIKMVGRDQIVVADLVIAGVYIDDNVAADVASLNVRADACLV